MKRNKKLLAAILSTAMLLTGCASTESTDTKAQAPNDATSKEATVASENTSAASEADPVLKDGEMTELLMVFPGDNSSPASLQAVEDGINEIIQETIDAKVKFQIQQWGTYADQTNLMLSSGEKLDIYFTTNGTKDFVGRGQLLPITDYIDTYAKETKEFFGDYLNGCYVSGDLYGFPTYNSYAIQGGISCRKDILDETGFKAEDIKTWDDADQLLAKVKELYPNMNILVPANINQGSLYFGSLGIFDDIQSGAGVYMNASGQLEVINTYATEEYKELAERAYDWNQKGYFMPDALTVTDVRQDLFKAGNSFGYFGKISPSSATSDSMACGMEMVTIPITDSMITTQRLNFAQWTIPAACEAPEKAVAFLNYLYTNADVQNLFHYGVEGKDYVVKDAEKGIAGYPEGVDGSNVGWSCQMWTSGNASIGYSWETDRENIYEVLKEFNSSANFSPLYGFVYDSTNVRTEITAVKNVQDKYEAVITGGVLDPESTIPKFLEELEAAGMQNIIDDIQVQVDAWLQTQ